MVSIYIGSEYINSPLGSTANDNFSMLESNRTGISAQNARGFNKEAVFLSELDADTLNKFNTLTGLAMDHAISSTTGLLTNKGRVLVILSTTKGDLASGFDDAMTAPLIHIHKKYELVHMPLLISNACISGVLSVVTAANLIRAGLYDHAIIIGIDVISDFVLYGFQSLYAMSNEPCAPFDKDRKGITLGEGCAAVVVSKDQAIFNEAPVKYLGGSSANDANHISGPSRTGEGLHRSIEKTLAQSGADRSNIDFISAHGTATVFNDEMESIAFDRSGLKHIPVNSFKGYYGHTLGAAGVIETAASIQSMRNNLLIANYGYHTPGTSIELNIIKQNQHTGVHTVLKTASGFGGCNASFIMQKI